MSQGLKIKESFFFAILLNYWSALQAESFKAESVDRVYSRLNHVASVAKITLGVLSSLYIFACAKSIIPNVKQYRNPLVCDGSGNFFLPQDQGLRIRLKDMAKNAMVQNVKAFVFYGTIMTFCLIEGINYFRSLQKSKKVSLKKKNEDKSKRSPKNESLILE